MTCSPASAADSGGASITAYSVDASNGAADPEYLDRYVGQRSLVQLGESIHVTDELPRVRLQFVRRLHEQLGFDVLALEGSLIASWLSQDHLYRSVDPPEAKARRAQELAWFGLWQTQAMLEVMQYVASTVGTSRPLYLASFDIQPGSSRAFGGSGAAALAAFFEALGRYQPLAEPSGPARWRDAIVPFFGCYGSTASRTSEQRAAAEQAVSEIASWIAEGSAAVARATAEQHALALQQLPSSLRASIELCARVSGPGGGSYQELRDGLNAGQALQLREQVSKTHKLMLWAHHSHINYNVTGKNPVSMGQRLHERLGSQMYSIGLFAGEGRALQISEESFVPIVPRRIRPAESYGVEGLLARQRDGSYFVDFSQMGADDASVAEWFQPLTSRLELQATVYVVPARDYDAAVFVREVHSTRLLMVPRWLDRLLAIYGWIVDYLSALLALASTLAGVALFRLWRRRRQQQAPKHTPE